jgi:hypothetical protein
MLPERVGLGLCVLFLLESTPAELFFQSQQEKFPEPLAVLPLGFLPPSSLTFNLIGGELGLRGWYGWGTGRLLGLFRSGSERRPVLRRVATFNLGTLFVSQTAEGLLPAFAEKFLSCQDEGFQRRIQSLCTGSLDFLATATER